MLNEANDLLSGADDDHFSNETVDNEADESNFEKTAMIYVYATIFVVGVSGNLWVLYWIAGRNRHVKTVTNVFIYNLSVADLFLMLCLPTIIMRMIIGEWIFGWFLCKIYFTFDGVNKFASVAFLVLLSLDRYLAVCHPITSRSFRNTNRAIGLVTVTWTIVGLLMIPVFVFVNVKDMSPPEANRTMYVCAFLYQDESPIEKTMQHSGDSDNSTTGGDGGVIEPRMIFTFYTFVLSYLLPLLLICVFYLLIVCRLKRQERLLDERTSICLSNTRSTRRKKRTNRQISVMVLTIVAAYTFCWLPYWILQLGLELFPDALLNMDHFKVFSFMAYSLQISNSALNPFLYALGTETHRREMLEYLCKFCCRRCTKRSFDNEIVTTDGNDLKIDNNRKAARRRRCDTGAELSTTTGGAQVATAPSDCRALSALSFRQSPVKAATAIGSAKSPKLIKIPPPPRPRSDLNLLAENISESSVSNTY